MSTRRIRSVLTGAILVCGSVVLPAPTDAGAASPPRTVPALTQTATSEAASLTRTSDQRKELFGGPGVWTKLSSGQGGSFNEPGLLRTSDGKLHVVWVRHNATSYSIGYSTISTAGKLLNTGFAVSNWYNLESTPRLVPNGKGIRLVFNGGQDTNNSNKFSLGARYTETSANGISWALVNGSLSHATTFNGGSLAAGTKADGTPVTAEFLNNTLYYHVGIDASIPAASDQTLVGQVGTGFYNPQFARDKDGSVWVAWFQRFGSKQGYYVERLLPSKAPAIKAPNSGNENLQANEPGQQVAFAARVGGGLYVAYCQESKTFACARIVLWKVGSKTPRVIPGTSSGSARKVTLSAGPGGRMVVGWYDGAKNVINVVRTNTKVTAFSAKRTVKAPPKMISGQLFSLFSQSSTGRIDLVANAQLTTTGNPIYFFHTQVLAALKVTVSPSKFSHAKTSTLKFHVTDVGEAVAGATVKFLGHTVKTNSKGVAVIKIAKGQTKTTRTASASKANYAPASVRVKIT